MFETELIRPKPTTHEGDVIELLEDLVTHGFATGQRGVVVSEFREPSEAYDIAFEDSDGKLLGLAYSVKPTQFKNVSQQVYAQGMELLLYGDLVEAERVLKQAVALSPRLRGGIHNSIIMSLAEHELWNELIPRLRSLLAIDPDYELAWNSLALAYLNYGVAKAKVGEAEQALSLFHYAIECAKDDEIIFGIRKNFAASFTNIGVDLNREGNFERSLFFMRFALMCFPSNDTRINVAKAHVHLARSYMDSGNYPSAVNAFESAWEAGLRLPELLNDQAIALIFSGRVDQGIRLFERALELDATDEIILKNLERARETNQRGANDLNQFNKKDYLTDDPVSEFIPIPAVTHNLNFAVAS